MSARSKTRAKPAQLSLEDVRALNASLSELAEFSKRLRAHVAHDDSPVIRPPSGGLRLIGNPVEVPIPRVRRIVMIPVGARGKLDPVPTTRSVPVVPWLDSISFFIPKSIREPFLGDLREDLANKAAQGHSRASIWWAAISQVAILALWWAWSSRRRR